MNLTTIYRSMGLTLAMVVSLSFAVAQPDVEPDSSETEDVVVVTSDTTEIAWRDKRFVIITDETGKRVEIKETSRSNEQIVIEDDDWDEDFEPEYDVKAEDDHKGGYSDVEFLGLDLGFMHYVDNGVWGNDAIDPATNPGLEIRNFRPGAHVALHFFPTTVSLIGRGAVNLKSAITIDWSNYYFESNLTPIDGENGLEFADNGINYEKSKLTTRYAQIPLLLNFNTTPRRDDGVSISVGGYAGILWSAHTKQVSETNGTQKVRGDFGLNTFRYGLMGRIDFKWFDFYAMYNLTPMFDDDNPVGTQTFTAGVNIINF